MRLRRTQLRGHFFSQVPADYTPLTGPSPLDWPYGCYATDTLQAALTAQAEIYAAYPQAVVEITHTPGEAGGEAELRLYMPDEAGLAAAVGVVSVSMGSI